MGFSRQQYWSGLPITSPGDLPHPEIKPGSSALQVDSLSTEPPGKPLKPRSTPIAVFVVQLLSCVRLFATLWTLACQTPLSLGFFRQEYWSGLPFPSPGDLPSPGIEPWSPALQADSLPAELPVLAFSVLLEPPILITRDSLVAQMVKRLPTTRETQVQSLG